MKIAIIGGGPIGIEAALYGACAGHDVQLFERGRIAENVRQWGHVRVFTEWKRNRSPLALRLLGEMGVSLAPEEETSTGDELADYVQRLAQLEPLRGRIHEGAIVESLTREGCLKSDFIDDPQRALFPFRLLVRDAQGERLHHADAVLDATGVYATPNWAGNGGAACPGELSNHQRIDYHLPDVTGREVGRFANKHTLVVGSGHSAASTLLAVCDLMAEFPDTRATWVVRRDVPEHGFPYTLDPADAAKQRQELQRRANEITRHPNVQFRPRTVIDAITLRKGDGPRFGVALRTFAPRQRAEETADGATLKNPLLDAPGSDVIEVECDNIAAHTGFRPDPALWAELQVPSHAAVDGPATLANVIVEQNRRAGVGLSTGYAERRPAERRAEQSEVPSPDECAPEAAEPEKKEQKVDPRVASPDLLRLPEPNFYVLGIKSYGRDAGFLMQNGFRQVRDAYRLLSGDMTLDLYEGALD